MAFATRILPHYTFEDWALWEGKWELYEGHPVAMSPTAIPRHQQVASNLRGELYIALKNCKHCKAYDPLDYKVSDDTILVPDVLVVCNKIQKKYLDFTPSLIAEILSPSTALRDRHTKYETYEQQGVKYYLIVDADKNELEVYLLIDGKYELCSLDGSSYKFEFEEQGCQAVIDFKVIW